MNQVSEHRDIAKNKLDGARAMSAYYYGKNGRSKLNQEVHL